jgi:hypothetical protein
VRNIDDGKELTVPASDESMALATLKFVDPRVAERGAAHQAFSLIFSLPFDHTSEDFVVEHRLSPPSPPSSGRARSVLVWSCGVAAGVGIVAGGLLLWDASRLRDDARDASQQRTAQLNDGIHARNVGAAVAFAIAGAAVTTGIVTWLLVGRKGKAEASPQLEVGLGHVQLSGRF